MSSIYGGNASNIALIRPGTLVVTNVSNTTNPTITVSSTLPGAFLAGTTVNIRDVQGATGVNGQWTVLAVTGFQTFTITAPAPGTYTPATGAVTPLYLAASTMPSDGDAENAASVAAAIQSLSDQAAALGVATGGWKLQNYFVSANDFDGSEWGTLSAGTAGTWLDWPAPGGGANAFMPFQGSSAGHGIPVNAGDLVRITTHFSFGGLEGFDTNNYQHAIWTTNYVPGAASPTYSRVAGASKNVIITPAATPGGDVIYEVPISLTGVVTVGTTGYFDWKLRLKPVLANLSTSVNLYGSFHAEAQIWRTTNFLQ